MITFLLSACACGFLALIGVAVFATLVALVIAAIGWVRDIFEEVFG